MKRDEAYTQIIRRFSRFIFYSALGLLLLNAIANFISFQLKTPFSLSWLKICIYILAFISFITPGIVIWFAPWFAYAWLSGINSFIPRKSWEELASLQKALIYFTSLGSLVGGILIGYGVITGIFPIS